MNITKLIFAIYHRLFKSVNRTCRFEPTCSVYFVGAVEKYGALKGFYLATKRILSCHPFSKRPIYDPA